MKSRDTGPCDSRQKSATPATAMIARNAAGDSAALFAHRRRNALQSCYDALQMCPLQPDSAARLLFLAQLARDQQNRR